MTDIVSINHKYRLGAYPINGHFSPIELPLWDSSKHAIQPDICITTLHEPVIDASIRQNETRDDDY